MIIKAIFENGDYITTKINATWAEITRYYLDNYFNLGYGDGDNMVKCIKVIQL